MCVANSARSQLAEGLAKMILGSAADIRSAGSHPSKVNPRAVQVLKEIGIDASLHYSKTVGDLSPSFLDGLNYVITLCAEEVCPVIVSKAQKIHWPLPDPAGQGQSEEEQLQFFRDTRDRIAEKLTEFKRELANL